MLVCIHVTVMLLQLCSSFDFSGAFQVPPNSQSGKSGTVLWPIFDISAKSGTVGKQ